MSKLAYKNDCPDVHARADRKIPVDSYSKALALGFLGVLCFSGTLPATRMAVPELGATFVGLGRAIVAACLAAILLAWKREPWPERSHWSGLCIVALGAVIGFPLFSALALRTVPASHSAVLIGLVPAATAVMATLRNGERPSLLFWAGCVLGIVSVLVFAATEGAGRPQPADALLFCAVLLAAMGYAEGARLARSMEGWCVICWALIFAAPFLLWPCGQAARHLPPAISLQAWLGFAYVSVFSMLLGGFAWYRALASGGAARIGQIQLVQPVLVLILSHGLLGESIKISTTLASLLVIASAALSQWTRMPHHPWTVKSSQ